MKWTLKRAWSLFRHTLKVVKDGDVLPLAEKLLKKEDGSFSPHSETDLPLGFGKIQNFIFVACPHITREVLHHDASPKCPTSKFDRGYVAGIFNNELGETLFTAEAPKHALLRQCVSQYFRQNLDKRFGANLAMRTHDLIESWIQKKEANISQDLPFFTSRAIIDNFIGEIKDSKRLHEAMELILRNMERQFKLKRAFPKDKMEEAQKAVREIANEAVTSESDAPSLLKQMANLKDEGQNLFSTEDIAAMARFLFLAGQETVASVLPALIYHCNETYQEKIRQEWQEEPRDMNSSEAVAHFASKSKWVQALINESLRLFPPAYAVVRVANSDVTIGELFVPKNTELVLFTLFFQRDTAYWGKDADQFNPERWFSKDKLNPPFIPFGLGPNHCLGQPFARLEIGIFLTLLTLRTKWRALNQKYHPFPRFSLGSKEDIVISLR